MLFYAKTLGRCNEFWLPVLARPFSTGGSGRAIVPGILTAAGVCNPVYATLAELEPALKVLGAFRPAGC